jgi:hypothetical protein
MAHRTPSRPCLPRPYTSSRFCAAIHLLIDHGFTGEFLACHWPRAPDPHGCQCRLTAIQTPSHVITECYLYSAERDHHLTPAVSTPETNIIFGGVLEASQACGRPVRDATRCQKTTAPGLNPAMPRAPRRPTLTLYYKDTFSIAGGPLAREAKRISVICV